MSRPSGAERPAVDFAGITPELLARYDRPGPRYTSYPTAPHFGPTRGGGVPGGAGARRRAPRRPAVAVRARAVLRGALHILRLQHRRGPAPRTGGALPGGGGARPGDRRRAPRRAPDPLAAPLGRRDADVSDAAQCERLFGAVMRHFDFAPGAEVAIEIDPCVTSDEHLATLRGLGFNRVSLGAQDFDPRVQEAVHRVQPLDCATRSSWRVLSVSPPSTST